MSIGSTSSYEGEPPTDERHTAAGQHIEELLAAAASARKAFDRTIQESVGDALAGETTLARGDVVELAGVATAVKDLTANVLSVEKMYAGIDSAALRTAIAATAGLVDLEGAVARFGRLAGEVSVQPELGGIQKMLETADYLTASGKDMLASASAVQSAEALLADSGISQALAGVADVGVDIERRLGEFGLSSVEGRLSEVDADRLLGGVVPIGQLTSTVKQIEASVASVVNASAMGLALFPSSLGETIAAAGLAREAGTARALESLGLAQQVNIEGMYGSLAGVVEMVAKANHMGEVLERIATDTVIPSLRMFSLPDSLVVIREAASHRLLVVERFTKRWKESPLWFMLSSLPEEDHYLLAGLEREEIEQELDEALEKVVMEGVYTQLLISALETAPYITDQQREDLQHGLEHAEQGRFGDALPPFLIGMEGALWSTGFALDIIDEERRLIKRPRPRVAESVEPVFKALPTSEGFSTFLLHRVFGGHGNHARHGRESFPRRQHVLCLVVALAGWMADFMEVPAREVLGQMLRDALTG